MAVDLVDPIKREADMLLRYSRSRPRFKINLAIDAILSVALVLLVFQFLASRNEARDPLRLSGVVAMSANDLTKLVAHEKLSAYWIGPEPDSKYTLIATNPGEVTITYFPKKADISQPDQSTLVVQTHSHFSADAVEAYAEDVSGPGSFLMNQGSEGTAIHYNPATPTRVTLTFEHRTEAVTIFNPTPQASLTLAMKPGAIQRIV